MAGYTDLAVGGLLPVYSSSLEVGHQLASKTGCIQTLTVHNYNATARMVLLLDQVADPTAYSSQAVVPIWAYPIAGLQTTPGTIAVSWSSVPMAFRNGLWVVLSTVLTTPFTATAASSTDGAFSALINTA